MLASDRNYVTFVWLNYNQRVYYMPYGLSSGLTSIEEYSMPPLNLGVLPKRRFSARVNLRRVRPKLRFVSNVHISCYTPIYVYGHHL